MSGRTRSRIAAGLAILAVAAVAGIVSYQHIEDVSLALHQTALAARLMPVAIDGLITVGSVVLLQSGSRLGWLGVGPGAALSLFANAESALRFGWLAAVWAAVPSVSFILATLILERWLVAQAKADSAPAAVPEQAAIPAVPEHGLTVSAAVPGDAPADVPEEVPAGTMYPAPVAVPETVPARAPRRAPSAKQKPAERVFAAELAAGELPSLRRIKQRARCGTDRARGIRDELAKAMEAQPEAALQTAIE